MDLKKLESRELDRLTNDSIDIIIDGAKYRFREPYLETLDYLAKVCLKMEFDEEKIHSNPTVELNRLKGRNLKLLAQWVAIFYLERAWRIRLFGWFYTRLFLKKIKPTKMLEIASELRILENDPAFINSTRLIAQMPRTSEPKAELVEKEA